VLSSLHGFAVTTLMTGMSDSLGGGMSGRIPVSAETGTRAGDPQPPAATAVAVAAIPEISFRKMPTMECEPRKNHAIAD
jgi:hypothetical protein